jgi:thiosulfate reductase cytochrome b subunit
MSDESIGKEEAPESVAEREAEKVADAAVTHALADAVPIAAGLEKLVVSEFVDESEVVAESSVEAVATEPDPKVEPEQAGIVLERKHPLAIRWMHWINFPVLFTMIWSGLLIYWNDSIPPYAHSHEVYRVGVGSWTLFRFFPAWFYTNRFWDIRYMPTTGLGYHFFFMWLFGVNGILYVSFLLISKEWKFMVPLKSSLRDAIKVTLVDLHLKKELPPQTKYNGGQRIAYTSVIVMGLGSLMTGLAIYKPTQLHWITSLLGGYEMARWLHFWLTLGFCGFFLVHVGQVILAGWNNFRAMVSGYGIRLADEPSLEAERTKF